MNRTHRMMMVAVLALIALPWPLSAEEAKPKVIAIGDVDVGSSTGGQKTVDVKETIQLGLKKNLERLGKGQFSVTIVEPAAADAEALPKEPEGLPSIPTDRPPTQKEIAKYMAAMQKWQRQMSGVERKHTPVAADAYFDFRVASSESGIHTGEAAHQLHRLTGLDTTLGDISTQTSKIFLIATMRDPKTGSPLDQYTAKASSVKVNNVGGYTSYDYGETGVSRERLFSNAVRDCAKWMADKVR